MAKGRLRETVCAEVVRMLREKRQERRISMELLAERAGLSQSMVSLLERDLRNPTLDTLLRIADALDVDLAEVLGRAQAAARRKPGS